MRRVLVLGIAVGCLAAVTQAGDPPFTVDVVTASDKPDFVLDDTDAGGQDWALEADEPVANAFAIGYGTPSGNVNPVVIESGAPANTLYLTSGGEIGFAVTTPTRDLHLFDLDNDGVASLVLEEATGTASGFQIDVDSTGGFQIKDFNLGGPSLLQITPDAASSLTLDSAGVTLTGSLIQLSSRAAKTGIRPIDTGRGLDGVLELPLSNWRYKTEPEGVRHLGPMAEDFHAAFGLGAGEAGIPVLDAGGVALAAIQGLEARQGELLRQKDREIAELRQELERLTMSLERLESLVANQE